MTLYRRAIIAAIAFASALILWHATADASEPTRVTPAPYEWCKREHGDSVAAFPYRDAEGRLQIRCRKRVPMKPTQEDAIDFCAREFAAALAAYRPTDGMFWCAPPAPRESA